MHGQGDRFLREFFRVATSKLKRSAFDFDIAHVTVSREELTRFNSRYARRMDITIHLRKRGVRVTQGEAQTGVDVVMIENKPFCGEQEAQMEDYCGHLTRAHEGRFLMIYLSKDGSMPISFLPKTQKELLTADRLAVLSYNEDIVRWIESCERCCQAENVQAFLKGFKEKINAYFVTKGQRGGFMTCDEEAIVEYALRNPSNLELVAEIGSASNRVREKAADQFCDRLVSKLKSTLSTVGGGWREPEIDGPLWKQYGQISVSKSSWPGSCTLAIVSLAEGWIGLRYGVTGRNHSALAKVIDLDRLKEQLDKAFGKGAKDSKWLWRQDVEGDLADITMSQGLMTIYGEDASGLAYVQWIFDKLLMHAAPVISASLRKHK